MYLIYIILMSLITGLFYLYFRFICTLSRKKHLRVLFFSGLIGILGLMILTLSLKHMGIAGVFADILSWVAYISIGFLSFLTTFLILRDLFLILQRLLLKMINFYLKKEKCPEFDRRQFLSGAFTSIIAGCAFSCTGLGVFLAKKTPAIKQVMLPVKNLPKSLESFSIVQISDIHLSATCKKSFLADVVAKVNKLKPDIIALTGDLADGIVGVLGEEADPLNKLVAKHGKFFVTGNHEYYFNAEEWIEKVESLGFTALVDAHELINCDDGKVLIAGVADYRAKHFIASHKSSPLKAIHNSPSADVKILLAHQPKSVFEASEAGFDIQLSGHTHGGQFFPWQLAVGIDQPYLAGLYKHEDLLLYVSRGTGYWGPPIRMGAPSEITLLKLTSV